MNPHVIESEIFGHERGAFTGATARKIGRIELAHGGTLFLNEVQNLSPETQAKLLEVFESGAFYRVGGHELIYSCFRLIVATNENLEQLMAAGEFRKDFYYRVEQAVIEIPPLRERREDILPLAEYFLKTFDGKTDPPTTLSKVVKEMFKAYSWPGNVRELRNVIQRAAHFCQGSELMPEHISLDFRLAARLDQARQHRWSLEQVERHHIGAVLEETKGNLMGTARILGIDRNTLKRKLRKYQLTGKSGEK